MMPGSTAKLPDRQGEPRASLLAPVKARQSGRYFAGPRRLVEARLPNAPVATLALARLNQRRFLETVAKGMVILVTQDYSSTSVAVAQGPEARFRTRGIVLVPEDFTLNDWPERAARAGLTTLAVHHQNSPKGVIQFIESETGQVVLARCRRLGLQVEYELPAMGALLPRELFARDTSLFRMDDQGQRIADFNCCVHSARALEVLAENAVRLAGKLRPMTGRYFLWGDDGAPWCRCGECRGLTEAEQALVVENHLATALRKVDERATVAHLAYANTLEPPRQVKPHPAVFLEYASINRRYDIPYASQIGTEARDGLPALDRNLTVFPHETAQVLEYWLDVSRFSHWKRPAKQLPWKGDVFASDLRTYAARGIRHVTTFGVWLDAEYVRSFGEPAFLAEYGRGFWEVAK
jgi:hypothetical protein